MKELRMDIITSIFNNKFDNLKDKDDIENALLSFFHDKVFIGWGKESDSFKEDAKKYNSKTYVLYTDGYKRIVWGERKYEKLFYNLFKILEGINGR